MIKSKSYNKFIIIMILISVFYGGIIVKVLNGTSLITVKKVLPEILIVLFLIVNMSKNKIKIGIKDFLIFMPILFFTIVKLYYLPSLFQIINVIRDLIIPIFIIGLKYYYTESEIEYRDLMDGLYKFFIISIIISFILGIIQYINGIEWTSKFYLNTYIYGTDLTTGIKIDSYMGILRIPSISGNHVIFAIFNFIAITFFVYYSFACKVKNKISFYLVVILSIINIGLTTSRTVILMTSIFILLIVTRYYKKIIIYISPLAIILVINFMKMDIYSNGLFNMLSNADSLNVRINDLWNRIFIFNNNMEMLFGKNIYNIGNSSAGIDGLENLISIDNMYIYIFLAFGIIGSILLLFIIIRFIRRICIVQHSYIIISSFIGIIIGGVFSNLFQGRVLTIYFLLIMLITKRKMKSLNNT